MSKPEGPVNIDLLALKKAEQPPRAERRERHTLADYAASASETTRAIGEALSRNMAGGHNNLLNVMPIVNPADPRLRFSADDAVNAAANGYSYYTRLTREVSQLDQAALDLGRKRLMERMNRMVNNEVINGGGSLAQNRENYLQAHIDQAHREFYSFPPYTLTATYCGRQLADYSEDEWAFITRTWREEPRPDNSYSPVFLPPAQYEADGNQLSVTVEQRHLPNLPRILTGLGIENRSPTMGLAMGAVEEGGKTFGWPVRVVRQLNNGVVWVEAGSAIRQVGQ